MHIRYFCRALITQWEPFESKGVERLFPTQERVGLKGS